MFARTAAERQFIKNMQNQWQKVFNLELIDLDSLVEMLSKWDDFCAHMRSASKYKIQGENAPVDAMNFLNNASVFFGVPSHDKLPTRKTMESTLETAITKLTEDVSELTTAHTEKFIYFQTFTILLLTAEKKLTESENVMRAAKEAAQEAAKDWVKGQILLNILAPMGIYTLEKGKNFHVLESERRNVKDSAISMYDFVINDIRECLIQVQEEYAALYLKSKGNVDPEKANEIKTRYEDIIKDGLSKAKIKGEETNARYGYLQIPSSDQEVYNQADRQQEADNKAQEWLQTNSFFENINKSIIEELRNEKNRVHVLNYNTHYRTARDIPEDDTRTARMIAIQSTIKAIKDNIEQTVQQYREAYLKSENGVSAEIQDRLKNRCKNKISDLLETLMASSAMGQHRKKSSRIAKSIATAMITKLGVNRSDRPFSLFKTKAQKNVNAAKRRVDKMKTASEPENDPKGKKPHNK